MKYIHLRKVHLVGSVKNFMEQGVQGARMQPNGSSEEALRRQRFFALNYRGVGEDPSTDVSGVNLN